MEKNLINEFYYGGGLRDAFMNMVDGLSYVDFVGAGETGNVITIDGELHKGESLIEIEIECHVRTNLVVIYNNYNDKLIVYRIESGEFIY